ncbi:MAG: hypothetical protein EBY09_08755, partial [Verrucomicrobia bacterium]|nr:hypothetical protein [Verrucomicrobiota bacterium]
SAGTDKKARTKSVVLVYLGGEQRGQREAQRRERADAEKVPARPAIAKAVRVRIEADIEHGGKLAG